MFRMLIVDDEPIIVDGLFTMLQDASHMELELYKAYSAEEAIKSLQKHRMDIVLTDIEMPKYNGLFLQDQIQQQWPRCKVVFLTGYAHSQYMHQSIRQGAVDYVLKTEGDEAILAAVEKAYHLLTKEFDYTELSQRAKDQMTNALPSLQKDYWMDVLKGEGTDTEKRKKRFEKLQIPLSVDQKVLLMIGRIDEWRDDIEPSDKELLQYCVQNIADEFMSPLVQSAHVFYDRERIVWLLQSKDPSEDMNVYRYVQEQLERIQLACRSFLKLSCSFALASTFVRWDETADTFDRLLFTLLKGFGLEKEMILNDRSVSDDERLPFQCRTKLKKLQTLAVQLEQGEETKFIETLDELFSGEYTMHQGYVLEIYYSLISMFISFMNRNLLIFEISEEFNLAKFLQLDELKSWKEMHAEFSGLAKLCFQKKRNEQEHRTNEIVELVQSHINQHLDGDLSLTHLSELVYLTPSYLSRLFRQNQGYSITDYITEKRLEHAKLQLTQTHEKIHRIGLSIGFESPPYFTKFIKKHTGMSPQEYRDAFIR